jgi:CheY-like chemotaxis protein
MNRGAIMLVEDNPDDVELTLRAFRQQNLGNEIIVARDGAEAEEMLFGHGTQTPVPALILQVSGLQVLKAPRNNRRTELVPVVVLTSSVEDEDIASAYEFGANSYIRKPVDFSEFVVAVQQMARYWLQMNEPPPGTGR